LRLIEVERRIPCCQKGYRLTVGPDIFSIAERQYGEKDEAQQHQSDGKTLIFPKAFGYHIEAPDKGKWTRKNEKDPPPGFACYLKPDNYVVYGNNKGLSRLAAFLKTFQ
jgi:hypothetical protein